MELIDRESLNFYTATHQELILAIEEAPTVEAVPKSYADQIRWERDIAIEQLNEIGCQFGQNMDEVKKKIEPPKGEWIEDTVCCENPFDPYKEDFMDVVICSKCGAYYGIENRSNFCPNCGADMRSRKKVTE